MQTPASKRSSTRTNGVVAGSVWETRMKLDQVKGGIKVFHADHDSSGGGGEDEAGLRVYNLRLRRNQSDGAAEKRKRKNWSPPEAGSMTVGGVATAGDKTPPARLRKTQSSSASNSRKMSEKTFDEERTVARSLSNAGGFDGDGGGGQGMLEVGDGAEGRDGGRGDVEGTEMEAERESFDDKEVDMAGEEEKKTPGNSEAAAEDEEQITQIRDIPISSNTDEKPPEAMEEDAAAFPDVASSPPKVAAVSDPAKPPPKMIDLELTAPPPAATHRDVTKQTPPGEQTILFFSEF